MDTNLLAFILAAVAFFSATLSPLALAAYNRHSSQEDKREEHRRQDKVAAQAAEAARLLAEGQERQIRRQDEVAGMAAEAARLLLNSNKEVAQAAQLAATETMASLKAIHTLVNSNLTEAQERELAATRAMLASMREVITMKQDRDVMMSPETIEAVRMVERRITELASTLAYKKEQTAIADLPAAAAAAAAAANKGLTP